MHLQRAVTPTEGDGPLTVTEQLDLVVTSLLDIQLNENVFIVANAVGLDLKQNLANQLGRDLCCFFDVGIGRVLLGQKRSAEDTLAFTSATTDRLETDPGAGVVLEHIETFFFNLGSEFIDRKKINPFFIRSHEDVTGQVDKLDLLVCEDFFIAVKPFCLGHSQQRLTARVLADQGA